jgi:hypothetical protein
MVGLGADPDQSERPGILGHVGEPGRYRRGRAVLRGRSVLVRGRRHWRGLIRLGLIRLGLIRLGLIRAGLIRAGLIRAGLFWFGSIRFSGERVIGRDIAGLGIVQAGLGGDDREMTRMHRDG